MSDNVTAARRRDLIESARAKAAKIPVPDTTHVGAIVLAEAILRDLDEALAVDAKLQRHRRGTNAGSA